MLKRPTRVLIAAGFALVLFLLIGRALADLYTEILWFEEVGFLSVFWKRVWAKAGVRLAAGLAGAALVLLNLWVVVRQLGPVHLRRRYGNLEIAEQVPRSFVHTGAVVAAVLAGLWLSGIAFGGETPLSILAWLNHGTWGVRDPLFQRDLSFFVFSLPVYASILDYLLLVALWCVLLAIIGYVLVGALRVRNNRLEIDEHPRLHFAVLIALMILVFAVRYWLGRYGILLRGTGFSEGVGYTDVHARLPAQRVLAVLSLGAAAALLYGAFRRVWWPPVVAVGSLLVASVALGFIYPSIVQKLRVEPTQLQRETRFIAWNLEYTRRAYSLQALERRLYAPRGGRVGGWAETSSALERLPLWDPEPLQGAFEQTQSLAAYYSFPSVHYDRYGPPGAERQVAIAVREFNEVGLQPENRTWETLHLNPRQVRGVGAVVTPVSEKTLAGDPVLWIRDVLPVRKDPLAPASLDLAEPTIYYGETTRGYLVLGSSRDSIGSGTGRRERTGVPLRSFARILAFSWRFGDKNLLFAGELTDSSRIIFRRRVGDRVARIAPFLTWDRDLHPVIARGRIVWMLDGYTASTTFPMASPRQVTGIGEVRYLRNVVKATVDAVTGKVALYALTDDDPILESYRRIFPALVQPLQAMPPELLGHMRYPVSYFQLQADILKDYHVDGAQVFFTGQNRWQVPQDQAQPNTAASYRPIYILSPLPGETEPQFLLTLPYIARDRQNMTALLVVRNDAARYGEIVLLEFPRDRQVTGPRQVTSLHEQDPEISRELSLLRQKGSVDYGRWRIVPLDSALVYVQPVYLSAEGTSIPQLQLVIASDGSSVNMSGTLPAAVDGLYRDAGAQPVTRELADVAVPVRARAEDALILLDQAEQAARRGDWAAFGERLQALRDLLDRLARE